MHTYNDYLSYSEAVRDEIKTKGGKDGERILHFISLQQTSEKFKESYRQLIQQWTYKPADEVYRRSFLICKDLFGNIVFQSELDTTPPLEPIKLIYSDGELFTASEF